MAAALLRRGTGLCCIHRELCRAVWRPQTALFSSKPSDRKQPRRTHIKKAKPQPAVDVAKLLEQLFSQHRPGTTPPAGKAQPARASSMPTKPPTASSMSVSTSNLPPLLKTEPAVSVFPPASSLQQVNDHSVSDVTVPTTSGSSPTSTTSASLGSDAAAIECQTSTETIETQTATVRPLSAHMVKDAETSSFPAAAVEPSIETTVESPVEHILSSVETQVRAAVVEGPVEPAVDDPAKEVQTSGVVDVLHTAKEPLTEIVIESPVEASHFPVETVVTRAAVVEGPVEPTVEPTVDVAAQKVGTKSTDSGVVDISHTATVESSVESSVESIVESSIESSVESSVESTVESSVESIVESSIESSVESSVESPVESTVESSVESPVELSIESTVESSVESTVKPSVEASTSPLETLESRTVSECPVDATIDATAQAVQINSTYPVEEPFIESTIDPTVEASTSPVETLESISAVAEGPVETTIEAEAETAAQAVQSNSTDSGPANLWFTAEVEPLIETTVEPAAEASSSPVSEPTIEPTIETEADVNFSHTFTIQNAQVSAPSPLEKESTIESSVESSSVSVAAEEGVTGSEDMTLESVTLHVDKVLVASLKTDELLQTKSILDEKAEKQLQVLLVQTETGAEHQAAAETENSREDESVILTDALSKWDSLCEDLQELEAESSTLVKELLWHVPAELSGAHGTVSPASDPPAGADGEQTEEKASEAEDVKLESMTLVKVEAEVGGLETAVLLETRNPLKRDADALAKEKMEVPTMMEDVAVFEADALTLASIYEATDATEAETAVTPDEATGQEAEEESGEQQGSVLEAMSLESVTLAEVEASLGTLENESLREAADYLEKEAEVVAGEKRMEVEDVMPSEEMTEAQEIESLSLSEDLQMDALMEELLFSVPSHITEGPIGQEVVRENILDATVATGSVNVDTAAAVTSPALKEVLQVEEEEGAQAEALGNEDGDGTQADLDPVQRLFLEKIREYSSMRRLNGGPLEAETDYEKYLSEETAKLQRLYGGGDLDSFPRFTFTEPKMDQDSK